MLVVNVLTFALMEAINKQIQSKTANCRLLTNHLTIYIQLNIKYDLNIQATAHLIPKIPRYNYPNFGIEKEAGISGFRDPGIRINSLGVIYSASTDACDGSVATLAYHARGSGFDARQWHRIIIRQTLPQYAFCRILGLLQFFVRIFLSGQGYFGEGATNRCEILYDGRRRTGLFLLGTPKLPQNPKFRLRISRKR